jgi:alpha/beta superfamily hydrolase
VGPERGTEVREITFPCGGLSLEGMCHSPEGEGPFAAVVVCHPHPLYGGSMSNNVVLAVCQTLAQQSILALRFNFRGVGGSQGELADQATGQEDVRAALSYVASVEDVDPGRIGLCGYSFGAGVAVTGAASEEQVRAVAVISPPLQPSVVQGLRGCVKPRLLIGGSEDRFISAEELLRLVEEIPPPKDHEIVSGADHFWWGYEGEAATRVAAFFAAAVR